MCIESVFFLKLFHKHSMYFTSLFHNNQDQHLIFSTHVYHRCAFEIYTKVTKLWVKKDNACIHIPYTDIGHHLNPTYLYLNWAERKHIIKVFSTSVHNAAHLTKVQCLPVCASQSFYLFHQVLGWDLAFLWSSPWWNSGLFWRLRLPP